jgi:hypothetical protein
VIVKIVFEDVFGDTSAKHLNPFPFKISCGEVARAIAGYDDMPAAFQSWHNCRQYLVCLLFGSYLYVQEATEYDHIEKKIIREKSIYPLAISEKDI